jgi:hypothetical protein
MNKGEDMPNDTSAALATVDVEIIERPNNDRIAVRSDWTLESFKNNLQQEKDMRLVLQQYVQDAMVKDHHYYSFKDGDKPALTQEGAHAIASLQKTFFGPPELHETYHEGNDHYSVRARIDVFNQQGQRIATGDGMCSTRESKYAYRWYWGNELPAGIDKGKLKTKGNQSNPQYQLPNQDLPDAYNTVLKMAVKRAKVAAVRQLPLVSELFVADDVDSDEPAPKAKSQPKQQSQKPAAQSPAVPTSVKKAVELAEKLVMNHDFDPEAMALKFLPEGVANFDLLTEQQAAAIVPKLVEFLNAQVSK